MTMSDPVYVCPKCGGEMVDGKVNYEVTQTSGQQSMSMMPFSGIGMPQVGGMTETYVESAFWEEKTGEKKGIIFKREETKRIKLVGHRCKLCGFVELYAVED